MNYVNLKLVVVGEAGVGKTCLIKRFVNNIFPLNYLPTLGANFLTKKLSFLSKNEKYEAKISIWDIAGQTEWQAMRGYYYKGANGIFVVGDLSDRQSFRKIQEYWIKDIQTEFKTALPIILLKNKCDLNSQITQMEIDSIKSFCNITLDFPTSAKTGQGVNEAFIELFKKCLSLPELIPI